MLPSAEMWTVSTVYCYKFILIEIISSIYLQLFKYLNKYKYR